MKKLITILLALTVMLSMLGLAASAASYREGEAGGPAHAFTVKKANSSLVVKDGVIKAGEYEKATVDVNNLNQVYFIRT